MDNDKVFAAYALTLMAGAITAITFAVTSANHIPIPPLGFVVEHLAMSLLFRSAYKAFDGSNWIVSALEMSGMITTSEEEETLPAGAMPSRA